MSETTRTTVLGVLAALVTNVLLDLAVDLPVLARWAIAVAAAVAITAIVTAARNRRGRRRPGEGEVR